VISSYPDVRIVTRWVSVRDHKRPSRFRDQTAATRCVCVFSSVLFVQRVSNSVCVVALVTKIRVFVIIVSDVRRAERILVYRGAFVVLHNSPIELIYKEMYRTRVIGSFQFVKSARPYGILTDARVSGDGLTIFRRASSEYCETLVNLPLSPPSSRVVTRRNNNADPTNMDHPKTIPRSPDGGGGYEPPKNKTARPPLGPHVDDNNTLSLNTRNDTPTNELVRLTDVPEGRSGMCGMSNGQSGDCPVDV